MFRHLRRMLPTSFGSLLWRRRDASALAALPPARCDVTHLGDAPPPLGDFPEWPEVEQLTRDVSSLGGAVNPGDRRAIYSLTRSLKPASVLEIGTHLGGSTVVFALALKHASAGTLTTVDILDVNGPDGPYVRHGGMSPRQLIQAANCAEFTTFVTCSSVEFLKSCRQRFDLIFLDGKHDAPNVYTEIPLALRLLNPGGVILLHDFFPGLSPLWSDGIVIPGPWLAVERLRKEGVRVAGMPLGTLPWPTKKGSNVTSLAYLLRTADREDQAVNEQGYMDVA